MKTNTFGSRMIRVLLLAVLAPPAIAQSLQLPGASVTMPGEGVVAVPESGIVGRRKADAAALARLSTVGAEGLPDAVRDPRLLATGLARQLAKVRTYGSWSVLLDPGMPQLAAHDAILIAFVADVREPDAAHVAQTAWDGNDYVYDDWMAIKDAEFAGLAGWVRSGPLGRSALRDRLGLRKYVQVLRQEQPLGAETYAYGGRRYVLLSYEIPLAGDFAALFQGPHGPVLQGPLRLELWVEAASGLLVKAHAFGVAAPDGTLPWELEQVFVGYGDSLRIEAPRR